VEQRRLLHYQVVEAVDAGALRIILDEFEPDPAPVNLVTLARVRCRSGCAVSRFRRASFTETVAKIGGGDLA